MTADAAEAEAVAAEAEAVAAEAEAVAAEAEAAAAARPPPSAPAAVACAESNRPSRRVLMSMPWGRPLDPRAQTLSRE